MPTTLIHPPATARAIAIAQIMGGENPCPPLHEREHPALRDYDEGCRLRPAYRVEEYQIAVAAAGVALAVWSVGVWIAHLVLRWLIEGFE